MNEVEMQALQREVAEVCGWELQSRYADDIQRTEYWYKHPSGQETYKYLAEEHALAATPDYPNDLNACIKELDRLNRPYALRRFPKNDLREWHTCEIYLPDEQTLDIKVQGETLAIAACEALKACYRQSGRSESVRPSK